MQLIHVYIILLIINVRNEYHLQQSRLQLPANSSSHCSSVTVITIIGMVGVLVIIGRARVVDDSRLVVVIKIKRSLLVEARL